MATSMPQTTMSQPWLNKKNGPRDVDDMSWVVSKFFFSYSFYFFIFSFVTNNCFIHVITTSMAIAVPWNTSWVNDDNGQPPTPQYSHGHNFHKKNGHDASTDMNQEWRTGQGRWTTKRGEVDAKNSSRDIVVDVSWAVGMFFIFSYSFYFLS